MKEDRDTAPFHLLERALNRALIRGQISKARSILMQMKLIVKEEETEIEAGIEATEAWSNKEEA